MTVPVEIASETELGTPATPSRALGLRFAPVAFGDGLRPPSARWCSRRRANGPPTSLSACRPPSVA